MSLLPPSPPLDESLVEDEAGHLTAHEKIHHILNNLELSTGSSLVGARFGTYAAMQSAAANLGDRWISTNQDNAEFFYNGTAWKAAGTPLGMLNLIEYGALIDSNGNTGNGNDDRAAWVDALTDMAATRKPLYVPYGVTGISRISTGINDIGDVAVNDWVFVGVGGKNGAFGAGGQVEVTFDDGGFEFIYGVSGSVAIHNLNIIGSNAPAVWMNNAAGLTLHATTLRGYGAGQPGLKSTDNFFIYADDDCSFMSGDTSTPAVLIESTGAAGGPEAWDVYLRGRMNIGCVKLDIQAPSGGANLGPIRMQDMVSENVNGAALFEIEWEAGAGVAPGQNVLDVIVDNCNLADASGVCDVVRLVNDSGRTQNVNGLTIRNSHPGGGGKVIQFVGANNVGTPFSLVTGCGNPSVGVSAGTPDPLICWQAPDGSWIVLGAQATVLQAQYAGEAYPRFYHYPANMLLFGNGATPPITAFTWYAGSPENHVTAGPGSYCADVTNGEGYIKKTGTGNTGWKLVTHA